VQLKKFDAAGVPVLWRPLHEGEVQWFWWGSKGPDSFRALWQLMFNRLTQVHNLHNLIWVYTAGTKMEWYPGDQYVDIVGVDAYPSDPSDPHGQTWDIFKKQFDGRKMMAISEFGKVPDMQRMHRLGETWAYFVSWTGDLGPAAMPKESLLRLYNNPLVLNRNNIKTEAQY
jgi:mannan endo-1,4-beta-mannosidase